MPKIILGLLVSYLIGSIPTAYIFGRLTRGIDLRQHGSGNMGATNAFRVLGKKTGTAVLIIDILKGAAAVLIARSFFYQASGTLSESLYLCLAAIAAVCGHNWTIFLGFKGGKGVATSLGVLVAFSIVIERFFWAVLSLVLIWGILFLSTGFVSLASVICSLCLPLAALFLGLPREITLFLALLGTLSVIRHKPNILRLLQKKENRFDTRSFFKRPRRETLP